jgi:gamma-butyrobetaine dioxygenase
MPILQKAALRGASVHFVWSDGFEADFASAWLLDNAASPGDPARGQRVTTLQSLADAGPIQGVTVADDAAHIELASEALAWHGAHLRAQAERASKTPRETVLWPRAADIAERPAIPYSDYLTDDGLLETALSEIEQVGLVRFTDAGLKLDEVERTVGRFGFIRETNYGRLFEVRIVADPENLANTARALESHTDNPYRDPAPTLQLLHCIRNSGSGGATFFLDGFALAEWFREEHADDFTRLAAHAVPFAFTGASGERYEARSPVLRLDADGALIGIRFNHRALGSVDFGAAETARWYESYLKFANEAGASTRHLSLDMQPGDIVLFDNERILHGRDAFSGASDRFLTGCYADRDGLRATLARLRRREF